MVLYTSPTTPLSRASSWHTAPQASDGLGYVSPLIDLYPGRDSDLEALYDSPVDWKPTSYDDIKRGPSGSEADLADLELLHTEDQIRSELFGS